MKEDSMLASYAKTLSVGQHKKTCPSCSHKRKKRRDPSLSIQMTSEFMVYQCHHCGFSGRLNLGERPVQYTPTKRTPPRHVAKQPLSAEAIEWLAQRSISEETAGKVGMYSCNHYIASEGSEVPCIAFPYRIGGQEVGAKIRSLNNKGFSCTASLHNFFNSDNVESGDILIIVEGEMDALSLMECGYESVVSVPNGAIAKVKDYTPRPEEDNSFRFLWDAKDMLDSALKVVIATDADEAGNAMAEELARRIGKDRVWKIEWPEGCKDANEALITLGKDGLENLVNNPAPWPVSGIYEAKHFFDKVRDIYENGLGSGLSTGYEDIDPLYTIAEGQITVVTGNPSSGKSEFIDQIMMNLAENHDYSFAVCSFENEPHIHIPKLASKYLRKPFQKGLDNRMSPEELRAAQEFIQDHFTFLYHADGSHAPLDDIISRLKTAVLRNGIKGCVIDPYNYIEKPRDLAETEWVSELMSRLRLFAQAHEIHIWFVAHPTKMPRDQNGDYPAPKGYDISGSAAWYAKADCGLTVHRPDRVYGKTSEVHIWKCRHSWIGKEGVAEVVFNKETSQYTAMPKYYYAPADRIEPPKEIDAPF